jgi:hypothetical protein
MKHKSFTSLAGFGVAGLLALLPACATQNSATMADNDMERTLIASGFKVRAANGGMQRGQLASVPDDRFTRVKQDGQTYYVYVDKREGRVYAGDEWAYRAYMGKIRNADLRRQGVFVWEVRPGDPANNKTVDVWNGYPPFREW